MEMDQPLCSMASLLSMMPSTLRLATLSLVGTVCYMYTHTIIPHVTCGWRKKICFVLYIHIVNRATPLYHLNISYLVYMFYL